MEVSGHLHARPLYPQGKSPRYPFDRRLSGPQSRSGRGSEEKNSQPLPGLVPPIIHPVAKCYTTELFPLLHTVHTKNDLTLKPFLSSFHSFFAPFSYHSHYQLINPPMTKSERSTAIIPESFQFSSHPHNTLPLDLF
jgi:hypothetical protein